MRGGLRQRLIMDSVRAALIAGLDQIGWFDPNRRHRPLRYIARPVAWDTDIVPNCFAISSEDTDDRPQSLGGDVEDILHVYIDLFAENDAVGWQLAGDLADLALGKRPDLGYTGPVMKVYDFRQATPTVITQLDIEDCHVDRAQSVARSWHRYWYMVHLELHDTYDDEFDITPLAEAWTPAIAGAWSRVQSEEAP